jgi:hypothetical protein
MNVFSEAFEEWREGSSLGSFAIVADFGLGKTTWLNEAGRRAGMERSSFLAVTGRATTPQEALAFIARGIGSPVQDGLSVDSLSGWLRSGERRLVIVDDLHLWYLRSINATGALQTFNQLVEQTGDRVFWLCSLSSYPYRYYNWASRNDTVFRNVRSLSAWPEEAIETLLRKRTGLTGWRLSFDRLMLDDTAGYRAETRPEDTAKDYNRLIWDLSLGSPRAAIQYWASSLSVDGDGVAHVQFFKRPEAGLLDSLSEQDRFVWHASCGTSRSA